MKKVLLIAVGMIVTILGASLCVVGVGVAALVGTDGKFDVDLGRVTSDERAIVLSELSIETAGSRDFIDRVAEPVVTIDSATGSPVFVGQGPQAAVAEYLMGVPRTVVTDVTRKPPATFVIDGNRSPANPAAEPVWTDAQSGRSVTMSLAGSRGQSLVVMNPDGSAGVAVTVQVGMQSGAVFPTAIVTAIVGVGIVIVGIMVIVKSSRKRPPAAPAAYVGPPVPPAMPAPLTLPVPASRPNPPAPPADTSS